MAFLDFLFGKGEKTQQFKKYTPQQEQILDQLLGNISQQLPQGFDFLNQILSQSPEAIEKFEAPARRAFEEKTLPTIAERFSALGAQKSSAFGQQLGEAGKRLEESLASQRGNLSFQALNQLQNLLGGGLTSRFETAVRPRQPGLLEEGAIGLSKLLPLFFL